MAPRALRCAILFCSKIAENRGSRHACRISALLAIIAAGLGETFDTGTDTDAPVIEYPEGPAFSGQISHLAVVRKWRVVTARHAACPDKPARRVIR